MSSARSTILAFASTLTVLCLGLAGGLLLGARARAEASPTDPYAGLDTLARVIGKIETQYFQVVPPKDLVYAAVGGIAEALDPHTRFFDPAEWQRLQEGHEGRYQGIGVDVLPHERGLRVEKVVADGPADRAGVLADDLIVAVDGEPLAGLPFDRAADRVRGPTGGVLTLTLEREGREGPVQLAMAREEVVTPSVDAGRVGDVGVARIAQFQRDTHGELERALEALEATGALRGLVLDLRQDPGGLLDEAVAVADLFLAEGDIVGTRGRSEGTNEAVQATRGPADRLELPLAVLIDGGSASAAEVVAGALHARGRATLVGVRSYGKGSVQKVFQFEDGSALKLTVARYVLPDGRVLEEADGLHPDVEVALPAVPDPLLGRLAALGLSPADQAVLDEALDDVGDRPGVPDFDAPLEVRAQADPQLAAALAALAGG